jgi:transcriptional regulator with XRE-family HTH domain
MEDNSTETEQALAAQIRAEMAYREMTQKELADIVGTTPAVISRYMRGHRTMPMDVYLKISRALGVSPNYLMNKAVEKTQE